MNITVYLGSAAGKDPFYAQEAMKLGKWIGRSGNSLVYGGSRIGLMGILAQAALEEGAVVIGVEPRFFIESVLQHDGISELIETETMAERKARMIELGDAYVAFPGGTGTLEEISEVVSMVRLEHMDAPVFFYNIRGYFDLLLDFFGRMVEEGFLNEETLRKLHFVSSPGEIEEVLKKGGC